MSSRTLVVGAVAYTPNVVTIWEGLRDYFAASAAPLDFVLYSNYARQVDSLLDGRIDIAWNTNLAWVRTVMRTDGTCRALAMRDTDLAFATVLLAPEGTGLRDITDLKGRRLALGSRDSAQAAILPVHFLRAAGLHESDVELVRHDSDLGKHGDTGRSELDAIRAVLDERADAAAVGITTWNAIGAETVMAGSVRAFWHSPTYCHCNFTALESLPAELSTPWVEHLCAMDWDDPLHRPILEMEGLRRWCRPELDGYASLFAAVRDQQISAQW